MASAVNSTACVTVHAQRLRTATRAQRVMRDAWAKVRATGVTIREALRQAWAGERERIHVFEGDQALASPSRRSIIGSLATLPMATKVGKIHPDAELHELEAQRVQLELELEKADLLVGKLMRVCSIDLPIEIFLQSRDFELGLSKYAFKRDDGISWYFLPDTRPRGLRSEVFYYSCNEETQKLAHERAREIVRSFDDWQEKQQIAYRNGGVPEANSRMQEIGQQLSAVEAKIESTPANTIHGLLIKADHLARCSIIYGDLEDQIGRFVDDVRKLAKKGCLLSLPIDNHVSFPGLAS